VSDEGSAAEAIRDAALQSPKIRALGKVAASGPLVAGVAVDAERLVGVGEAVVGPEEYADIWLATVGRVLVTTNVGTQVNMRTYRADPRIHIAGELPSEIANVERLIADAFRPFIKTPDRKPRPRTVFVEFTPRTPVSRKRKVAILRSLSRFVNTGKAVGTQAAPKGHRLGLAVTVKNGERGRDAANSAIDLAADARVPILLIDAAHLRAPDSSVIRGGLREAFRPGHVAQILRHARSKGVSVRAADMPDTDTIARGIWSGLNTARLMGAQLGKYGCAPLTLDQIDIVVQQIQEWYPGWSTAPVFFVDQGLISAAAVDDGRDLPRGIERWLSCVAGRGARVVLIDTVEKSNGRRLLKRSSSDESGYLGPKQVERIEAYAKRPEIDVRVLWAGGFGLRDVFFMGRLGVFGVYVTSAAATTIPVLPSYVRDPALSGLKEPTKHAVLLVKTLLEAGFLSAKLRASAKGALIDRIAQRVLSSSDLADDAAVAKDTLRLARLCIDGWKQYWN
jgi:hypothetical protein